MELNITKQTVCIADLSFNQNVEQGLDFSVNIPEYCGSVQKILKYTLIPRIFSKKLSGQTLMIEGNACFSIVFLDENGCVGGYECVTPFSKNLDIGSAIDCLNIHIKPKCGYINAKAITPTRIDVNSVIELSISIYSKKATEIIGDIDCADVFINRGEAPATSPVSATEKSIILEEEIALLAEQPSIYGVLRHDSKALINDIKIVNNKVIVKGDFCLHLLYCSDNRKPCHLDTVIPFSQIVELDGIHENCKCNATAEILSVDIKPRSNFDGDVRSFILCAKLCLNVNASCDDNIAVIFDAYSSKFDTSSENSNTTFEKLLGTISEVFACKKEIEFSEGELNNVIDLWCNCVMQGWRIENNSIFINGTVTVCGLCEDAESSVSYFEKPIDFEYCTAAESLPGNARAEAEIDILSLKHSVTRNCCLALDIELSLSVNIYEKRRINVLTDFKVLDETQKNKKDCSMVIYYAERGEHTWNIAKRFGASPEDIMTVNSVDSVIPNNMPLIISR